MEDVGKTFEEEFGKFSVDELITGVSSLTLCRKPGLGGFGLSLGTNVSNFNVINHTQYINNNNFFHNSVPVIRSKKCIRSSPSIRNLSAKSLDLSDDDSNLFDKSHKAITTTTESDTSNSFPNYYAETVKDKQDSNYNSSKKGYSSIFFFLLRQMFWSISLLVNIFLMFWLIFGSPYDPTQSHWIHHVIHNATETIMTNTPILWEAFRNNLDNFLDILTDFTIL